MKNKKKNLKKYETRYDRGGFYAGRVIYIISDIILL